MRACALLSLALTAACGDTATSPDVGDAAHADAGHTTGKNDAGSGGPDGAHTTKPDAKGSRADALVATADAHTQDAAREAAVDAAPRNHGDASTTYPAFTPDVPQVQYQGGETLPSPRIVTITWPNEPNATALEAFGDDVGPSSYWNATTHEYGVGAAHSGPGNHVRLTEQPLATWTDAELATWLAQHLTNNTQYGLPAPDTDTVYAMYLSTQTDITVQGSDGCQSGVGGYHDSIVVNGLAVAYAVVLQCDGAMLTTATQSMSHELIEASTDPTPNSVQGYVEFDGAHLAWDVFQMFQDEVADACEFYYGPEGSFYTQTFPIIEEADAGADGGDAGLVLDAGTTTFSVQRTWSNAAALAGHHPCVPAVAGPYFAVTPLGMTSITLDLTPIGGGPNSQTQGYRIPKGGTQTFAIGFHSDAPTSGPWTITAAEGTGMFGGAPTTSHVTLSIDVPQGQNGDISYVTVTVNSVDTSMNGELVTIVSDLTGYGRTYVPILISNE